MRGKKLLMIIDMEFHVCNQHLGILTCGRLIRNDIGKNYIVQYKWFCVLVCISLRCLCLLEFGDWIVRLNTISSYKCQFQQVLIWLHGFVKWFEIVESMWKDRIIFWIETKNNISLLHLIIKNTSLDFIIENHYQIS
jgi:hypothetical protein